MTIVQKGKQFDVSIYSGNALAIFVYEYKDSGEDWYMVYNFLADEEHCANLSAQGCRLLGEDVGEVELNLRFRNARALLPLLVKDGYKVLCYEE